MAAPGTTPLMSLLTPGTMKHVVPWKTRSEFLSVYQDLYSDSEERQVKAINRIATWKSRVGTKLSVAIESSASLVHVCLDHVLTERNKQLEAREGMLRSQYSVALIRFVNHITEKGQTKAVAQPVHLVAREFGIPEWIVRLRHDATHSAMPSLDTLSAAARWALHFLQENFWEQQGTDSNLDHGIDSVTLKRVKLVEVRRAFYAFQKARFAELNTSDEDKVKDAANSYTHTEELVQLQKYLTQNRMRFIQCLLEDGILISSAEQLAAFGVDENDLLSQSPPVIPLEMCEFWRPLLQKLYTAGALPLLLHTAMFYVTGSQGLRNFQLVAWMYVLLSHSVDCRKTKVKGKKKRKAMELFKVTISVPKKTLLSACLHNVNQLTVHLLKYLADADSLGADCYTILSPLLKIPIGGEGRGGQHMSSNDSDSDTVYTVEDVKRASQAHPSSQVPQETVEGIRDVVHSQPISWHVCTNLVDWSTVALGSLPSDQDMCREDEEDDERRDSDSSDDNEGQGRRRRKGHRSSDDNSDESKMSPSPKRTKYVVQDAGI